ncbi:molecular chaperone TorD family protein [Ferrimicrobium sp.]|uniref:molecular chaperone TorD family protein n=1 Tax=Ferrimicrobium sp. TaxID=2926050 RepID=UPI002637ABF6|nr:molecular chaperone TorD family protein [Ferrimicrobium sp.]
MVVQRSAEILEAIAEVIENPDPHPTIPEVLDLVWTRDAFTELFDFDLPPFASYYLTIGPVLGGTPVDYLRGLLSAYLPPELQPTQPDSLAFLLRLLAFLAEQESWERAEAIFYEALNPWLSTYAHAVATFAPSGLRRIGILLGEICETWYEAVPPVTTLPYLLRHVPEPPSEDDRKDLVDFLLSPVASGLILPRSQLIRITHQREIGMRPGGRRFSFESLLDTSPKATLAAVLESVEGQLRWYQPMDSPVSRWWQERLTRTHERVSTLLSQRAESRLGN